MHIPFTRYGLPQVLAYPAITLALMVILYAVLPGGVWLAAAETILFLIFVWMLLFFRNPRRVIPLDENVLLSPADGTVTDIAETECPELGGRALRIGMFLSVFNVHINRTPCSVSVEKVIYRKGKFKNAMSAESGRVNESNGIVMKRLAEPRDPLMVRQVSGAVARRIVCGAKPGGEYPQGAAFGMIKFGSRTELYVPLKEAGVRPVYDVTVKPGDKVNAGLSPLIVYKP
jgi:phosphatidylserine decarboxylase